MGHASTSEQKSRPRPERAICWCVSPWRPSPVVRYPSAGERRDSLLLVGAVLTGAEDGEVAVVRDESVPCGQRAERVLHLVALDADHLVALPADQVRVLVTRGRVVRRRAITEV